MGFSTASKLCRSSCTRLHGRLHPRRHGSANGWTLTELLIVILLAGIISAWAVPSYRKLQTRARLDSTSNQLLQHLRLARQTAMLKGRNTALCAGDRTSGCTGDWSAGRWIVFLDNDHNGQRGRGERLVITGYATHDIVLSGNGAFRTALEYNSRGFPKRPSGAFGAGRLRVCTATRVAPNSADLVLAKSGRLRVQKNDFSGQCPTL